MTPVQYTILKGGRTSLKDQITLITDLFQLRPEEQKILDSIKAKQNLQGAPVCYIRFQGQEREEFFCDKELEREKKIDRERFVQDPSFTEAEKQQLAAALPFDKERVLNTIRYDRQKYLDKKLTYNSFTTVLRQICNFNKVKYVSQIKYDKSTYDIVYYIYF